jgi:hypothetical protein
LRIENKDILKEKKIAKDSKQAQIYCTNIKKFILNSIQNSVEIFLKRNNFKLILKNLKE